MSSVVLEALRDPERLPGLSAAAWTVLLRDTRRSGMLSRLDAVLDERGLLHRIPSRIRDHLLGARLVVAQQHQLVRWEVTRIHQALRGVPLVLLKGSAYVLADLPIARGRLFADVDVLVPRASLLDIEESLLRQGWRYLDADEYNDSFYREWSHELPPLQHHAREIVVDVHHTILPPTGRLHPDPALLLEAAVELKDPQLKVLAPADMLLHTAVHMFQDGELNGEVRDLVDLDVMLRHFGTEPAFWERLVPRARQLGLERPLFYGLRYTQALLGTPVPRATVDGARAGAPPWPVLSVMDALVTRSLTASPDDAGTPRARTSRLLLYVRSHWLRMPPLALTRHLLRKTAMRLQGRA